MTDTLNAIALWLIAAAITAPVLGSLLRDDRPRLAPEVNAGTDVAPWKAVSVASSCAHGAEEAPNEAKGLTTPASGASIYGPRATYGPLPERLEPIDEGDPFAGWSRAEYEALTRDEWAWRLFEEIDGLPSKEAS